MLMALLLALTPVEDAWGELMYNIALCRDHIDKDAEAKFLTTVSEVSGERDLHIMFGAYAMGVKHRHPKFDAVYCVRTLPTLLENIERTQK